MKQCAAAIFVFGALSAVTAAEDLSKYRTFQLGMDLPTVANLAGTTPSQAKVIHSRPALIQELTWRPQPLGMSARTEPAKEVAFDFFNGELYQITVSYDRHEIEGLTAGDLIEAISSTYGPSAKAPADGLKSNDGGPERVLAQWQDSQYRFSLIQSSYGTDFKLAGVLKRLETAAQSASIEAKRLDDKEAPQREAARLIKDGDAERARLEQARLVNKPKFRM